MDETRFTIVFRKLAEALGDDAPASGEAQGAASPEELDEIEELRRVIFEVLEEPAMSYTTT